MTELDGPPASAMFCSTLCQCTAPNARMSLAMMTMMTTLSMKSTKFGFSLFIALCAIPTVHRTLFRYLIWVCSNTKWKHYETRINDENNGKNVRWAALRKFAREANQTQILEFRPTHNFSMRLLCAVRKIEINGREYSALMPRSIVPPK